MITIQPFGKVDFKQLIAWAESEDALIQFAGHFFTFPLTTEQLDNYIQDKNRLIFKVIDVNRNNTIGHAEIQIVSQTISVLCRIIIGDKNFRGQGIGQQIIHHLLEISFIQLLMERVELYVFDWNISAIKCYEKSGFTINAEKSKKREVRDQIWTALNMSIEKADWKKLKKNNQRKRIVFTTKKCSSANRATQ